MLALGISETEIIQISENVYLFFYRDDKGRWGVAIDAPRDVSIKREKYPKPVCLGRNK